MALFVRQVGTGRSPLTWVESRLSVVGQPAGEQVSRRLVVAVTPAADNVQPGAAGQGDSSEHAAESAEADDSLSTSEIVSASDIVSAADIELVNEETASAQPADTSAQVQTVSNETDEQAPIVAADSARQADAEKPEETAAPEVVDEASGGEEQQEPLISAASVSGSGEVAGLPTSTPTSTQTATPASTPTSSPTTTIVATETPVPTDTATPAPMPSYEIQRGDTLIVIARKNEVTVDDLMRVNGITAAEAFSIQPGQELLIPVEGSAGSVATTPTATIVPTVAVPPTDTPVPKPTTPSLRLDAPILRSPEPGTPVSCSAPAALAWLPVPFMRAEDKFVLHLGFVSGRMEDGRDIVIWVLEQPFPATVTSWDMDGSLCALAPQEYKRKWHWFVEVVEEVDGAIKPVSPSSKTWDFNWN